MSKQKKNGFTLVELLAVIVILAVILVIAVPQIMNVITESRKGALASSAKLIASSAETAYISNQTLGIEKTIECSDVSNYTEEDYASCKIKFVDGKAKVTLIGQGKFEGMSVCGGTKEEAEVKNGNDCPVPAVEKIESLAVTGNTEGLIRDGTADNNIRYAGGSPKNYVKFNNEDWRIIGIFNVKTASGKTEKLMKIVKNTSIGRYSWDSSESGVNAGMGVSDWSQADLKVELNTLYLNSQSGTCYNGFNNLTTSCNFTSTGIKDTYRNMIENVVWNAGTLVWNSNGISASTAYDLERTAIGNTCTNGVYCNTNRSTIWRGFVGIVYPSDYGYASTNTSCRSNINDSSNKSCKNSNWLHTGGDWTLSYENDSSGAWYIDDGYISSSNKYHIYDGLCVRPTLYLKSDVLIESGEGTQASPYQISMS